METGKTASSLGIGGNDPRTIAAWVLTRSFNNGGIFDVGNRSNGQDFCLRTLTTDNLWRIQYWGGAFDQDFTYPTLNEWVHFGLIHDGTDTKLYADGLLIVDVPRTLDTPDTNPFQIGVYGWQNDFFDGLIDDVQVYNRALSDAEVAGMVGLTQPFDRP
ncbi:MAG: LamG domain-containing protein [Planctomycetes bacterium]|nr:LamG domain-containing protein [Planctomycetota bacterium]